MAEEAVEQMRVECVEFVSAVAREIIQSSDSKEEMLRRLNAVQVGAYALPVTKARIVVVIAGEAPRLHTT